MASFGNVAEFKKLPIFFRLSATSEVLYHGFELNFLDRTDKSQLERLAGNVWSELVLRSEDSGSSREDRIGQITTTHDSGEPPLALILRGAKAGSAESRQALVALCLAGAARWTRLWGKMVSAQLTKTLPRSPAPPTSSEEIFPICTEYAKISSPV